jgi:hypothetical protein
MDDGVDLGLDSLDFKLCVAKRLEQGGGQAMSERRSQQRRRRGAGRFTDGIGFVRWVWVTVQSPVLVGLRDEAVISRVAKRYSEMPFVLAAHVH